MVDSVPASAFVLTDANPVELLNTEVKVEAEGDVAATLRVETAVGFRGEDKAAGEVDFVARDRDRDDDDSAPASSLVWMREVVNSDDVDEDEDADADAENVDVLVEMGAIVELVNRDFDKADEEEERERVDVAAMDEGEDLAVNEVAATDVCVDLVEETDEESLDEESLVDNAGADVARGSSADEVVSDPAPVSSFARLVAVAAPTNQIR